MIEMAVQAVCSQAAEGPQQCADSGEPAGRFDGGGGHICRFRVSRTACCLDACELSSSSDHG